MVLTDYDPADEPDATASEWHAREWTYATATLCDVCSDPVDIGPESDAHSHVDVDPNGYPTGERWWHPECCPDCSEGHNA